VIFKPITQYYITGDASFHNHLCGNIKSFKVWFSSTKLVSWKAWSEFLATNTKVLGSIPGATRFPEKKGFIQPRE
jgi:hypothetical protein